MTSKSCYIIGLPSAGKTTFLAALAYSLQQRQTETKLKWSEYDGDHQYLTNLTLEWLRANPVNRTNITSQQQKITIKLTDINNNLYVITFPDLSGEIFQSQYKDREMDMFSNNAIKECDGILLFVNPKTILEPSFISSISPELRRNNEMKITERDALNDPTEVQLVELLQFVNYIRNATIKLTVVISAWDVIENNYSSPEKYLKDNLTLLWQYLYCNNSIYNTCYYGVSAQGGELINESQKNEMVKANENNPEKRIKVIDNYGNFSHDISLPLWQAMNIN